MNIISPLFFVVLLQFSFCSDRALQLSDSALQPRDLHSQKAMAADAIMVFKSADDGQTWQDISNGLPATATDDNGSSTHVFFTDDSGLYLTDGNGLYHSEANTNASFWRNDMLPGEYYSIAPGKQGIYAYSNRDGGIFQKANGSGVWSQVFTNFPGKRVFSVFETAAGIIFIGSDRGLFKSINSGKSWKQLAGGGGKMVESNGVLLTTSQGGILRSTDEGESWALVISEGGVGIDVERIKGGFAAISYSTPAKTRRIRTSYDGGNTWQAIDAGFPGQTIIAEPWRSAIATNPAPGSADSAWHPKEAGPLMPEYKTSVIQVGESFFCGHSDGVYRSSDNGKTWKLVLRCEKGKMFKVSVSGNVIYAIQMESHC